MAALTGRLKKILILIAKKDFSTSNSDPLFQNIFRVKPFFRSFSLKQKDAKFYLSQAICSRFFGISYLNPLLIFER